jgi:GNAT superfamily N-acetyltransferase
VIRRLEPADIPACAALLDRLPEWFGLPESNARYIDSLRRLPAFVAVGDGALVGFLAVEPHTAESVEISVMAVERSLHRHGCGRELVAAAETWCIERDVEWLHVKTRGPATYDADYERTRRFYRAMGFAVLYESATEWGPENAALILVKHLPCRSVDRGR